MNVRHTGGGSEAGEIALSHLIAVRIQEGQRAAELDVRMRLGEVENLGGEVLIVGAVVEGGGGEALSMSLQRMGLFDLTAVGQSDVVDAKVALIVVSVRTDLTFGGGQLRPWTAMRTIAYPNGERFH